MSKSLQINICKLCQCERPLIEAHLFPKWCVRHLRSFESDNPKIFLHTLNESKKRPDGLYDNGILCENCDNKLLGPIDNAGRYFCLSEKLEKLSDKSLLNSAVPKKTFGLFVLSVIWRFSISQLPECKTFSIGAYEQRTRDYLWSYFTNQPVADDYDFLVTKIESTLLPNNVLNGWVKTPECRRLIPGGVNVVTLFFPNGYQVIMKFDQRNFPPSISEFNSHGVYCCVWMQANFESSPVFKDLSGRVNQVKRNI